MRRIVVVACCLLWLSYGSLSGLAHSHTDSTPAQHHGLGLDHAHDPHGHEPVEDDHSHGLDWVESASSAHHDGPLYLNANAVKPGAKRIMVSANLASPVLMAPQTQPEAGRFDGAREPRDPPSKEPPGLRGPPA